MNNITLHRGVELGLALVLLTAVAFPFQVDQEFAQAQLRNAQALRQYTWKSRTEVRRSGETKNVQLSLMRYDSYGTPQKTPISSTPQQQLPTRGIRGLIAQKKKENFMETMDKLASLARSYGDLSPSAMQRFMTTATVTPEIGQQQKLFRIQGGNVLQPGDSMTVWIDAGTRKVRRVDIQTSLDRKPVRVSSDFENLPNGPTYTARSIVDYPSEELTLITENFDYQLAGR